MSQTVTHTQELPITDTDGKPVFYRKVVPICDCNGHGIYPGSVLEHVEEKDRGVVAHVYKRGDRSVLGLACEGDLAIRVRAGVTRVTNKYSKWRHVLHAEQTYEERYQSWMARPFNSGDWNDKSKDEQIAIDGIMSLLPRDIVDYDHGPFPDSIENALQFLANHLTDISKEEKK